MTEGYIDTLLSFRISLISRAKFSCFVIFSASVLGRLWVKGTAISVLLFYSLLKYIIIIIIIIRSGLSYVLFPSDCSFFKRIAYYIETVQENVTLCFIFLYSADGNSPSNPEATTGHLI
jgi:hypothetical protein